MNELKEKLLERIEVDKESSCWVWTGAKNKHGYGQIWHEGKTRTAHRVFFEVFSGDIPEGLDLDHLCRKRSCCNFWHLEPVTRAVNIRRGVSTKLDWNKVRKIRKLYADGLSQKELARMFGVSNQLISRIVRNEVWKEKEAA